MRENMRDSKEFLKEKLKTGYEFGLTCDISSICTLECPACLRTTYRNNGLHPGHNGGNLTKEQFDKIFDWYDWFNFCGQVSDPIFNPDLEYFLDKSFKAGKHIRINTAATAKNKGLDWYKRMFDAHPEAKWTFGIDGLDDKSEWHRINQDSELIFNAMKLASTYPDMDVVWQYIIFSFNENDVDEAIALADELGVTIRVDLTSAFGDLDYLKPKKKEFERVLP